VILVRNEISGRDTMVSILSSLSILQFKHKSQVLQTHEVYMFAAKNIFMCVQQTRLHIRVKRIYIFIILIIILSMEQFSVCETCYQFVRRRCKRANHESCRERAFPGVFLRALRASRTSKSRKMKRSPRVLRVCFSLLLIVGSTGHPRPPLFELHRNIRHKIQ